ncbi:MliC family protein [Shewanella sp. JM162201]|uniref:MliC family protein n=1 Tax=Shewanella jiangmenensis TaxID=2837387 RepID=A0ABS5V0I1_9GAMM|nr:MliC family protein [Shewanella jiangmenensis]MBT1443965.1 MliC family protein [Shewanella jiangmenensis]
MNIKRISVLGLLVATPLMAADAPSFDCSKLGSNPHQSEKLVCEDAGLAALDRKLAEVFSAAAAKAANEHPPSLKAEQRGWIKGRDECWKADDARACVEQSYQQRIAELQARYRLLEPRGPFVWNCGKDGELVVSFFDTEPPSLIAERGDSVSLMFIERSGSGAKYQGRNESFWEHQGEATVSWGYGSEPFRCTLSR